MLVSAAAFSALAADAEEKEERAAEESFGEGGVKTVDVANATLKRARSELASQSRKVSTPMEVMGIATSTLGKSSSIEPESSAMRKSYWEGSSEMGRARLETSPCEDEAAAAAAAAAASCILGPPLQP